MEAKLYRRISLAVALVAAFWLSTCMGTQPSDEPVQIIAGTSSASRSDLPPTPTVELSGIVPQVPAGEGLAGNLVFSMGRHGIGKYDFASGELTTLFVPPQSASVSSVAVSPSEDWIVMAYAPPPPEGEFNFGYTDLYFMPADASTGPIPLVERTEEGELFSFPTWSPDEQYVYYGHVTSDPDTGNYGVRIERIAFPEGQPELIVEGAYWPRLSSDGQKLAYLAYGGGSDGLVVANADGSNPMQPIPSGYFVTVDAPTFSSDGQTLAFSAVSMSAMKPTSLLGSLLGVKVASAHSVPSDLYQIPVEGGTPSALTTIGALGLYPSYAPDDRYIAYLCSLGIYLMESNGANPQQLIPYATYGSLQWIP